MSSGSYIYFFKNGYESKKSQYNDNTELVFVLDDLHVKIDEISVSAAHNILGNSKLTNIVNKNQMTKTIFNSDRKIVEEIKSAPDGWAVGWALWEDLIKINSLYIIYNVYYFIWYLNIILILLFFLGF